MLPAATARAQFGGACQFHESAYGPPGGRYLFYEGDIACPFGGVSMAGNVYLDNSAGQEVSSGTPEASSTGGMATQGSYTGSSVVAGVPTDTYTEHFVFTVSLSNGDVWLAGPDPDCSGIGTPIMTCNMALTFPYSNITGTAQPPVTDASGELG